MDEHEQIADAEEQPQRSLRNAGFLTAGVGAAHAILFLLSFYLLTDVPRATASDAEIIRYYGSDDSRRLVLVGLYVMPFAGIAFIWFAVALRMWISGSARRINVLLSNVQLVSGVLFVALFFSGAAAIAVTATAVEFSHAEIDPILAREFPQYGASLLIVFGMRMAAMFVFATANIGRHAKILPRWFVILSFLVGAFLLLSATLSRLLVLVFPIWVLLLSVILFDRARRIPADAVVPQTGSLGKTLLALKRNAAAREQDHQP